MKNFLRTAFLLIVLYLVLIHFSGFSSDVSTLFSGTEGLVTTFQGRTVS
jgi:hypothetical protein